MFDGAKEEHANKTGRRLAQRNRPAVYRSVPAKCVFVLVMPCLIARRWSRFCPMRVCGVNKSSIVLCLIFFIISCLITCFLKNPFRKTAVNFMYQMELVALKCSYGLSAPPSLGNSNVRSLTDTIRARNKIGRKSQTIDSIQHFTVGL